MQNALCRLALATSLAATAFALPLRGQQLPDAPGAAEEKLAALPPEQSAGGSGGGQPQDGKQTKRILGLIPNFKSVSVDETLPPMTVKEKFVEATEDSFDYSSLALPALVAYEQYETNATPEFGTGGVGFGRYLWHSVLDQTSENYWVEFIGPVVTREDPRFYTLGRDGFKKRTVYSLTRIFITRTDSGGKQFNYSEIIGAGASAGLSNAYYPSAERKFSKTANQWGTSVGIDAFSYFFKEFWPDINNKVFHGKQ